MGNEVKTNTAPVMADEDGGSVFVAGPHCAMCRYFNASRSFNIYLVDFVMQCLISNFTWIMFFDLSAL